MARPSLFSHRKFTRLSRMLGAAYKAAGVLEVIWHHAYQDGDPRVGTAADIEFMVGWDGAAGDCARALIECGFLDERDDCELVVHDLDDHAPEYVKARSRKERQRRREREQTGTEPRTERDTTVTVTGHDRDCHPTPAPAPAPTPIDASPNGEACSEPEDSEPPILTYPVVGSPDEWGLPQSKLDEYAETYPGIDAMAEARKARQWCVDNPAKRKTARGMTSFLNRWMEKAQNRGHASRSSPSTATPSPGGYDAAVYDT